MQPQANDCGQAQPLHDFLAKLKTKKCLLKEEPINFASWRENVYASPLNIEGFKLKCYLYH